MVNVILQKIILPETKINNLKIFVGFSIAFISIVGITVLQDLAGSIKNDYAFYLSESLLFKTFWLLFIPLLYILYKKLQNENVTGFSKTFLFIVIPVVIHIFLIPFIAGVFSNLFFAGRYDLYKFLSYTLAHDFYIMVIIYTGFVLSYKYLRLPSKPEGRAQLSDGLKKMVITHGKDNTIIDVKDILQITSATPYIFIHLENKKYLHTETLKSIGVQLDNKEFVRVHKSAIVNIGFVQYYKSRLNGDYDLYLKNGESLRLSRTYAGNFKRHFTPGHPDTG